MVSIRSARYATTPAATDVGSLARWKELGFGDRFVVSMKAVLYR